jgi:nitrate/nitrite-specific signal transduction histidine kinase
MRFPKLNPESLSTKIIAWSFIPTVIILTAVAWYTFYAYQRVTSELVVRQDQELVELNIRQITENLISVFNPVLVPVLFDQSFVDPNYAQQRDAIMTSDEMTNVFDAGTLLIDEAGNLITAHPERPDLAGHDWLSDPHFTRAIQNPGRGSFSDVRAIGPGGSNAIVMTMAVRSGQNERFAVLVGLLKLASDESTTIDRLFRQMNLGDNIYIVDDQGILIYHSDPTNVGANLSEQPAVQRALHAEPATGQTFDDQGNPQVFSYAPVFASRDWILIKEQPLTDLMAPSRPYTSMLLALLAMGVVIPSIVVGFGLRRILKPVDELIAATMDIAGGNFGHKIPVESNDELAELAHQFNRMSDELHNSYTQLEQRVEDRTRQLATLNAISAVVSRSLDLEEVLSGALEEILDALPFETGAAYQEDGDRLQRVTHCGLSDDACAAFDQFQHMAEARPSLDICPTALLREPELRERLEAAGIHLVVTLPLVAKGQRLGLLSFGAAEVRDFSPEEQALLRSIAEQVAVAVENARLYARAEEAAVAEERSRLARDLHDAVTQTLFSTSLIAEALPQIYDANPAEGRRRAEELRQLTRGALAEMRTLLLELRPHALAEARLEDLLRQLADAVIGRARVPVNLQVEGSGRLPAPVQIALYRITQEALNNIVKHASAAKIDIFFERSPQSARLVIQDDGAGFDPAAVRGDHFGLSIMRERAAASGFDLTIASHPGDGTKIIANWNEDARSR